MEKLPAKLQEKTFSQISMSIGMWGQRTAYPFVAAEMFKACRGSEHEIPVIPGYQQE
ncbi:MAG: hypothetical protein P1V21_12660 [Rhizobiaceae bacterium]|nr:hypothetical protein [Rhizobiaceae bacterium]